MAGLGALGAGGLFAGKGLAVVGAGLLAGVVGGSALVASGTVQFGRSGSAAAPRGGPGLELLPCPDQGPILGTIAPNQQVLITAKSADGAWLQLYWPAPGIERAWTQSGPLRLQGDAASLPVAGCEARPTPTPTPTPILQPTTAPTPSASAANRAPRLASLATSSRSVSYDQGEYCTGDRTSVTVSVTASDADGLASVNLWYRPPGAAKDVAKPMTLAGGKYVARLDSTTDNLKTAGDLRYYVLAKDLNASPKTTKLPKSGYQEIPVKVCKNTGPSISFLRATPTSIVADPHGVGCAGSTLTELRAKAADVDRVKSIRLYFKKPGAGSYASRLFTADGDTWYSSINTVASVDNMVRPGNLSWYVVATDEKGATTKSSVRTIKVTRCDSEATFDDPQVVSPSANQKYRYPCGDARITFGIHAADRDSSASKPLRITFHWTLSNRRTGARTEGSMAGALSGSRSALFTGTTSTFTGQTFYDGAASFFVVTVDQYGGTTTSPTYASPALPVLGC